MTKQLIAEGPTPERIRHMGQHYQPPLISQKIKRPYASQKSALSFIRDSGKLDEEQLEACERLRNWLHGAEPRVKTSSYGLSEFDGTPVSQKPDSMITEEWNIYCATLVAKTRAAIEPARAWEALELVLLRDLLFKEAGYLMGYQSDQSASQNAGKWFYVGVSQLKGLPHVRFRSDTLQQHPSGA